MLKHPFVQLVLHGIGGSLIGIISGLLLSFVIRGLLMLVLGEAMANDAEFPAVVHMLGMGVGATVGGILGGVVGLKKA